MYPDDSNLFTCARDFLDVSPPQSIQRPLELAAPRGPSHSTRKTRGSLLPNFACYPPTQVTHLGLLTRLGPSSSGTTE